MSQLVVRSQVLHLVLCISHNSTDNILYTNSADESFQYNGTDNDMHLNGADEIFNNDFHTGSAYNL